MPKEKAYHKLDKPNDFSSIQEKGFRHSTPPEDHWLGSGIYFFLDPNGKNWAQKWPMGKGRRANSSEGIIETTVETEKALDFRCVETIMKVKNIINIVKLSLKFEGLPSSDGKAIAILLEAKNGLLKQIVDFRPTVLVANFDAALRPYRIEGSELFLNESINEMIQGNQVVVGVGKTTQIQACVTDDSVIGEMKIC